MESTEKVSRKRPGPKVTLRIVGHQLKTYRLRAGMSIEQVSRDSEISSTRIQQFERGVDLGTTPKTAKRLAAAVLAPYDAITEVVKEEAAS